MSLLFIGRGRILSGQPCIILGKKEALSYSVTQTQPILLCGLFHLGTHAAMWALSSPHKLQRTKLLWSRNSGHWLLLWPCWGQGWIFPWRDEQRWELKTQEATSISTQTNHATPQSPCMGRWDALLMILWKSFLFTGNTTTTKTPQFFPIQFLPRRENGT